MRVSGTVQHPFSGASLVFRVTEDPENGHLSILYGDGSQWTRVAGDEAVYGDETVLFQHTATRDDLVKLRAALDSATGKRRGLVRSGEGGLIFRAYCNRRMGEVQLGFEDGDGGYRFATEWFSRGRADILLSHEMGKEDLRELGYATDEALRCLKLSTVSQSTAPSAGVHGLANVAGTSSRTNAGRGLGRGGK